LQLEETEFGGAQAVGLRIEPFQSTKSQVVIAAPIFAAGEDAIPKSTVRNSGPEEVRGLLLAAPFLVDFSFKGWKANAWEFGILHFAHFFAQSQSKSAAIGSGVMRFCIASKRE
jgi:hypothetical protein